MNQPTLFNSLEFHSLKSDFRRSIRRVFAVMFSSAFVACISMHATAQTTQANFRAPITQQPAPSPPKPQDVQKSQFDQNAAFGYLKEICDIGPRPSHSRGMEKQQERIVEFFTELGAQVDLQPFTATNPQKRKGRKAQLNNIIVQFHPERKKRLLICCHHDTRPFADADPKRPRGAFIGANDGGSGVALLFELGKHMKSLDGTYGIDFVFFDGEEFVIQRNLDKMFLGSTHFATEYDNAKLTRDYNYTYGILVDMVADKDLQIYFEGNSLGFADGLTRSIWTVAQQLGVKEFIPEQQHKIRDDHLPLNNIGRIITCDIIDFDFPNPQKGNVFWHTQKDTIENCSAESLGKVGSVLLEWLRQMQDLHKGDKD